MLLEHHDQNKAVTKKKEKTCVTFYLLIQSFYSLLQCTRHFATQWRNTNEKHILSLINLQIDQGELNSQNYSKSNDTYIEEKKRTT